MEYGVGGPAYIWAYIIALSGSTCNKKVSVYSLPEISKV